MKFIDPRALNPDNVRIGENLRYWLKKTNERRSSENRLTWRALAQAIPLHHVTLAKAVAGTAGLAEEKILALAASLGVHPGRLIHGVSKDSRDRRFPHIPSPTNRNTHDRGRKGLAVSSIEALLKNPRALSSFLCGIADRDIPLFAHLFLDLRDLAAQRRKTALQEGRYDPTTGKFTE